jgi:hypothetical protein
MVLTNMQLFHIYNWSGLGCSTVLALLYAASLCKNCAGEKKIRFVITQSALLMVSNICTVLNIIVYKIIVMPGYCEP